ncbi:MAG: DedA family protein [Deltaproteobacteria bacterium]|nr:DedA family protein [Deltaproteobacteria bacterium]
MNLGSNIIQWLASDNGLVVHLSIFGLLVLGGMGFPIPEDIPLIVAGVAASKKIVHLPTVFATCYLGVMLGDQIMFFIGHFFGQRLILAGTKSRFFPSITADKLDEIREGLRKRRLLYIFVARHLFPIRSMTFITAGALRVPYFEFLAADAIAGLVSVGVMTSIGFVIGESLTIDRIQHIAEQAHLYLFGIIAIILMLYALHAYIRLKLRKRSQT